jgi:hypothetical protein
MQQNAVSTAGTVFFSIVIVKVLLFLSANMLNLAPLKLKIHPTVTACLAPMHTAAYASLTTAISMPAENTRAFGATFDSMYHQSKADTNTFGYDERIQSFQAHECYG